jgi:hypothetical protein
MKIKLLTAICAITLLGNSVFADEDKSLDVVADVAIVRPGCLAVTIAGTALFLLVLPAAAISKSVKRTEHTLVGNPAHATFTRPLGDFDSLED